jgi:hypothetical protein
MIIFVGWWLTVLVAFIKNDNNTFSQLTNLLPKFRMQQPPK